MANGTDISCVSGLASDGRVVTGNRIVGEAIARRWLTPRGRLIGDPDYGFDLTQFVNADMSPRDIEELQSNAEKEALKDERVEAIAVSATLDKTGLLTIVADVTTAKGPFELTVSVTDVTIQLISVT